MLNWSRREFIASGSGAVVGLGLGAAYIAAGRPAKGAPSLRPPGALPEKDFLAACIRCGQCVEACPTDVLSLSDLSDAAGAGTPSFNAAVNPCNLCQGYDSLKCIDACPTAALSPIPLEDIDIGEAHICKGKCLAYNGVTCRTCWHVCPFPDEAIDFDELLRVRVQTDACIGCGLCQHACPTDPKAITITSRETFARRDARRSTAGGGNGGGGNGGGSGGGRGHEGEGQP